MTVAVRLLYALAVLPVISAVLQLSLHRIDGFTASSSVVTLLVIGLLAYYVGRGRNVARIVLWVAAACEALSTASYAALKSPISTGTPARWRSARARATKRATLYSRMKALNFLKGSLPGAPGMNRCSAGSGAFHISFVRWLKPSYGRRSRPLSAFTACVTPGQATL